MSGHERCATSRGSARRDRRHDSASASRFATSRHAGSKTTGDEQPEAPARQCGWSKLRFQARRSFPDASRLPLASGCLRPAALDPDRILPPRSRPSCLRIRTSGARPWRSVVAVSRGGQSWRSAADVSECRPIPAVEYRVGRKQRLQLFQLLAGIESSSEMSNIV